MGNWSSRYNYNSTDVNRYAPSNGGVYRLIYKRTEKFYVFYVGQSNDLKRRLLEHLSPSEPDTCIKRHLRDYTCYFRFIEIASQSERDKVERQQIQEYKPSCNG